MEYRVSPTEDFELDGLGSAPAWASEPWLPLTRVNGNSTYGTKTKMLYSPKGIYFLVECEDRKLTCTMTKDQDDIYKEDVVEVFLWTDEKFPLYFEYEISPLNVELTIMVPNVEGRFFGWLPWHYTGDRLTRRSTRVIGGEQKPGASVSKWITEFYFPYELLRPLGNVPPKPGTKWRANVYRIDYDEKPTSQWAWDPATGPNFHDYRNFGTLVFG